MSLIIDNKVVKDKSQFSPQMSTSARKIVEEVKPKAKYRRQSVN